MTHRFQLIGDQRSDGPGRLPYSNYPSSGDNLGYQYFDLGHFPNNRNEITTGITAHSWNSWRQMWPDHADAQSHGPGINKAGSKGFWIYCGGRYVPPPTARRQRRVELAVGNPNVAGSTIYTIYVAHEYSTRQTSDLRGHFYPLYLPPGEVYVRAAVPHSDPNDDFSFIMEACDPGPDQLGGYSAIESFGWDSTNIAEGSTVVTPGTNDAWGSWTELGTNSKRWSMYRVLPGLNETSANAAPQTFQISIGNAGDEANHIVDTFMLKTTSSEDHAGVTSWYPCDIPQGSRISARLYSYHVSATWGIDSRWLIEGIA